MRFSILSLALAVVLGSAVCGASAQQAAGNASQLRVEFRDQCLHGVGVAAVPLVEQPRDITHVVENTQDAPVSPLVSQS